MAQHTTVAERSGPSPTRFFVCSHPSCDEYWKVKIVFALKDQAGLLSFPDLYCPSCFSKMYAGPWGHQGITKEQYEKAGTRD